MQVETFLPPNSFYGARLFAAVDEAWCTELRGELGRRGFSATGHGYPAGYRDNDRLVFDDAALAARLYARLAPALPAELWFEGERWRRCGLNPRFRACRYRGGQSFCVHRDGPHLPDDDTRSLLTVQLYLDDAAAMTGGRTRFYADQGGAALWAALEPRRGDVIVFDHRAWHDGEAVTAGEKQVLRSDAMYRRVAGLAVCDSRAGRESVRALGRHRGYGWRVAAGRDGSIYSSGRDGTVRRWSADPQGGELARYQVARSGAAARWRAHRRHRGRPPLLLARRSGAASAPAPSSRRAPFQEVRCHHLSGSGSRR